jgi:hypothetical protein
MRKYKKQNYFTKNNQAVAGIIVAVMLLGLVISVISIVQTVYIPKWMEEREAEHMGVVLNQMSQFKYSLDNLAVAQQKVPITTSITLGGKELGFLSSTRAFGHVQLIGDAFSIIFSFAENPPKTFENINLFTYTSENGYFLDQTYTYETGALFLNQSEGSVMLNGPSISVVKDASNNIILSWNCINLEQQGGKTSLGGYGTVPLQMTWTTSNPYTIDVGDDPVSSIEIRTKFPNLWEQYFDRIFQDADLTRGDGASGNDYQITPLTENGGILIEFWDDTYLNFEDTTIHILIGS